MTSFRHIFKNIYKPSIMMALSAFIMLTPLAAKGAPQAQKENTIKSEQKKALSPKRKLK